MFMGMWLYSLKERMDQLPRYLVGKIFWRSEEMECKYSAPEVCSHVKEPKDHSVARVQWAW